MTITTNKNDGQLTVALSGTLTTDNSPELEAVIKSNIEGVSKLIFDFSELEYLTSSGLRILLASQKKINAVKGKMIIKNVNDAIVNVFTVTGMIAIFTLE